MEHTVWGGFKVPESELASWVDWLDKYKKEMEALENAAGMANDTDYPGSIWPHSWKGLGPGDGGFPPREVPPWGFKAKNTGLPTLCYQAPDSGICEDPINVKVSKRWGYNPYIEDCQEFDYNGCKGNMNNFISRLKCQETCIKPGPDAEGCYFDTDIPISLGQYNNGKVPEEFWDRKRRMGTRRCNSKKPTV